MSDSALYQKVCDYIETGIAAGKWTPGAAIPTVRELTLACEVSHLTVLRAYRELKEAGRIALKGKRYIVSVPSSWDTPAIGTAAVGLLVRPLWPRNDEDNFFNDINYGIQDECCLENFTCAMPPEVRLLNQTAFGADSGAALIAAAKRLSRSVDGFLLDERLSDSEIAEIQQKTGKPAVIVGRRTRLELDSVAADWNGAANRLCQMAERVGYRRFLFAVSTRNSINEDDKIDGFRAFAAKYPKTAWRMTEDYCRIPFSEAEQQLVDAVRTLGGADGKEKIAVLCSSDSFARAAVRILSEHFHWQPGRDCGIGGLGGLTVSRREPPLATVDPQPETIGRMAVHRLLERISDRVNRRFDNSSPEPVLRWEESL